jgi:hypothetical protein
VLGDGPPDVLDVDCAHAAMIESPASTSGAA